MAVLDLELVDLELDMAQELLADMVRLPLPSLLLLPLPMLLLPQLLLFPPHLSELFPVLPPPPNSEREMNTETKLSATTTQTPLDLKVVTIIHQYLSVEAIPTKPLALLSTTLLTKLDSV